MWYIIFWTGITMFIVIQTGVLKKFQDKFGLSDYQVVCISFAKGFIIGAILL